MKKQWMAVMLGAALMISCPVYAQETEHAAVQETEHAAVQETEASSLGEEQIGKILDSLGSDRIRDARRYLADGGVIRDGYRGDAGAGLQRVLVDFGCGITIDGAVGAKTMEALHQVEEAFGLPQTEEVDLALFDMLLPLDLLTKGEADADLEAYFEKTGGPGYSDYLKACSLAAQGKYYSAKEAFENCSYGDSEARALACVQELPESGEIWRNPEIPGTDASLTFTVHSADESKGMCFVMFNMEDQVVSRVLVRGSGSATARVPAGTYHIMDGTGYEWYGATETFGPSGSYEYLTFSEEEEKKFDAWLDYGSYELEVNVPQIAEGATRVGSSGVGWKEYTGID